MPVEMVENRHHLNNSKLTVRFVNDKPSQSLVAVQGLQNSFESAAFRQLYEARRSGLVRQHYQRSQTHQFRRDVNKSDATRPAL